MLSKSFIITAYLVLRAEYDESEFEYYGSQTEYENSMKQFYIEDNTWLYQLYDGTIDADLMDVSVTIEED